MVFFVKQYADTFVSFMYEIILLMKKVSPSPTAIGIRGYL